MQLKMELFGRPCHAMVLKRWSGRFGGAFPVAMAG
jgi:hypothetical protein